MLHNLNNNEIKIYIPLKKPLFLKILNFQTKVTIIDMSKVVLYLLDDASGEFLGEIPVSWKGNEKRVRKLLRQHSKVSNLLTGLVSAKVVMSGSFKLSQEKIIFFGKSMKLRVSRENIENDFGKDILIRSLDEPRPKMHSCD